MTRAVNPDYWRTRLEAKKAKHQNCEYESQMLINATTLRLQREIRSREKGYKRMAEQKTVAELAAQDFDAWERVRAMEMANTPDKYEDRKNAFIALAEARAIALETRRKLNERTGT